jgi:hypothetical protein
VYEAIAQAAEAAREADRADAAWSLQMEAYGGPAQPSPTIGQCFEGGYACSSTNASMPSSREFNVERPHEALDMKCPAELYVASPRPYDGLPELSYPFHDREILVTACGRLCLHRKRINISIVLAGQKLGIKEVDEGIWLASFMHYDLILRPGAENFATPRQPVRPEVVTHVLGTICYPCLRAGHSKTGAARGIRTPDPVITNDVWSLWNYFRFCTTSR